MHVKLYSKPSKHILFSVDQFLLACNEAVLLWKKLLSAFGSLVHVKMFYNLMRNFLCFFPYLFRRNKYIFFYPCKYVYYVTTNGTNDEVRLVLSDGHRDLDDCIYMWP